MSFDMSELFGSEDLVGQNNTKVSPKSLGT